MPKNSHYFKTIVRSLQQQGREHGCVHDAALYLQAQCIFCALVYDVFTQFPWYCELVVSFSLGLFMYLH